MKKIVCLVCVLLSYSAAAQFYAGFHRINISPNVGDHLFYIEGGLGRATVIKDDLYINIVTLTDGKSRIALISVEVIDLPSEIFSMIKSNLFSIGFDHVVTAVTHTHGGHFSDMLLAPLTSKVVNGVQRAMQEMKPVSIVSTQINVDESYNRRVKKHKDSTKYIEMLWTNPERVFTHHVDQTLGVIQFRDTNDEPFVTLFNFSAHPVVTMDLDKIIVSADYPGGLRRHFESTAGGYSVFFMGASGDVNPYNANSKPLDTGLVNANKMGAKLSQAAQIALSKVKKNMKQGEFKFNTLVFNEPSAEVSLLLLTKDIALGGFPGEYFDALGRKFKENSPSTTTFFIGKSNGDLRYVPTSHDVELGGFGADINHLRVKPTTGEQHINRAIQTLNMLHSE